MKNKDKFLDEIADVLLCSAIFCDFVKNVARYGCCNHCPSCKDKMRKWLESEYVEPEIDWNKVPEGTRVVVEDSQSDLTVPRVFALYLPSSIAPYICYNDGEDRYTAPGLTAWRRCKLADSVDPTPYYKDGE